MKRSITRATAGLAALALVAGACGSDDDSSADDSGDAEETADTEAAADEAEAESDEANDDVDADADAEETEDTAAADDAAESDAGGECDEPESVSLQLQWFTQAQFGGYYAAIDQGFYEDQCLDVEIKEGAVEIVPQTELANGNADFAIAWVPKALQTREAGAEITNIAQVFERSGTLQVSFADAGITSPADFEGKTIGNWGFGNEYEVFAAIGEAGLDPASDVELVGQQFDMVALLEGEIDAAEAMTYNEYAQVLEAVNPDTGELYQPEDFNVVNYEEEGVGMLQDAIWADSTRLADDEAYRDQAVRFVAASLQGWAYCRDNVEECATIVTDAGSTLGASHQQWMMNEVNKLIWPASGESIGLIDQEAWDRTVEISKNTPNLEGATVLAEDPAEGAFTNDIVTEAVALLGDVDLVGADFAAIEVTLNEGGE
ncbi:ABC transporter substrate-binding protein [Ilumatobacter nonamiensis]|uniref:ABC transporter substrate-binding protein n=1 Tax=Ilumatobacter nonamiensis TaxID=467093 RepID=UPI00034A6396|nr:ABC transporter substrate-binding protein [Ilumatobacter nonamiensis]